MRVTFHQLEVFDAVARRGSFVRAAEDLGLSPPTVSTQVKQLAEIVGMPLFEQIGKRVFLTDAGRAAQATAREMLSAWARLEADVAALHGMKKGRLRVAAVTTAKYVIPRLLGAFAQRYPDIEIALEITNRERVLERLQGNQDDLYVMALPPEQPDLEVLPFLPNPLVVVAAANHPLAGAKEIALARLAAERFVLREKGSGTRTVVERFFAAHRLAPTVKMEFGSNEAVKQAVAGGLGLSILSRHTLGRDPANDDLAILDVAGFPIRDMMWSVVHIKGKQLSPAAKAFYDFLKERPRPA